MPSRRDFLKVGASGALLLAMARVSRSRSATQRAEAIPPEPALDGGASEVLAAIVPVVLAGALPVDPSARSASIAATIERAYRTVSGLPPHSQSDLRDLFALLGFAPARWLLAGVRHVRQPEFEMEMKIFVRLDGFVASTDPFLQQSVRRHLRVLEM